MKTFGHNAVEVIRRATRRMKITSYRGDPTRKAIFNSLLS